MRLLACLVATTALSCALNVGTAAAADEWGSIEGQFVLEGEIPQLAPLIAKGATEGQDFVVCGAAGVPDESLVVNPDNKGIANVCLWLRKAPSKIHPDLLKSAEPEVVLDQVGCRFTPHIVMARVDQKVVVKNGDPCNHNTNVQPFAYQGRNLSSQPNDRTGQPFEIKKMQLAIYPPLPVSCSSHAYMKCYWMVSDHPYMAVSDADGKFKIENLPPGEHTFRVWQERQGWVACGEFTKELKVKVEAGKTTDLGTFKVNAEAFNKK